MAKELTAEDAPVFGVYTQNELGLSLCTIRRESIEITPRLDGCLLTFKDNGTAFMEVRLTRADAQHLAGLLIKRSGGRSPQ